MVATMSVDSLRNNITDPARGYLWELIIPNPLAGDTETFLIRARTASMPQRTFGNIHIPFKQTAGVEFPGKITYPHVWAITFIEGSDRQVLHDLYSWMNQIIDDKTGIGVLVTKVDMYCHLIDTTGATNGKYKMVGCWPEAINEVGLDWDSEAEINIPTSWRYDRWEFS